MSLHLEKRPFRIHRRWVADKVKHVGYEADFWEGPVKPGGPCGYRTLRGEVSARNLRRTISPSVSFWSELQRALA